MSRGARDVTPVAGTPAAIRVSRGGLLAGCSAVVLAVAVVAIYAPLDPVAAAVVGAGCCLASLASLAIVRWPLTLSLRQGMLAIPGLLTGLLVLAYGNGRSVMIHVKHYHTFEVTSRVLLLTAMALAASAVAWWLAAAAPVRRMPRLPAEGARARYWFYGALAVAAATLAARSRGPYIWKAAYASASEESFLKIGVLPSIAVIGVLGMYCMVLTGRVSRRERVAFLLVALYALVNCMLLHGMRMEVFAVGIAMYAGYHVKHGLRVRPVRLAFSAALLYLVSQVIGALRTIAGTGIRISDAVMVGIRVVNSESADLDFTFGTFSGIAATFYNTVGLCDDGFLLFRLGGSYLDFIPRTLPELLYPDRPTDLAWIFADSGLTSGGGIFELAEAYLNFGVIGCIVVPLVITWLIARLSLHAERDRHFTAMMAYLVVVSLFFRGIWYQTFALYKTMLTWLLIELALFAAMKLSERLAIRKPA